MAKGEKKNPVDKKKGKKGKKDGNKKKPRKKKEPSLVEIIEEEPEPLLEEFILEPTSDSEHERELCTIPAAIHLYYRDRQPLKTESALALELARMNQPVVDTIRGERLGHLRGLHRSVMTMISFYFKIPVSDIENGIVDCDEHVELFDSVFENDGRHAIVFCHTIYNLPDPNSSYKTIKKNAIAVTTGLDRLIDTTCVIFYRTRNNFQADSKSLNEEYFYKGFNLDDQVKTTAAGLDFLMRSVVGPCIGATSYWGELNKTPKGIKDRKIFQHTVSDFQRYMTALKDDVDSIVKFDFNEDLYYQDLLDPVCYKKTALNSEKIQEAEATVQKWAAKIKTAISMCQKIESEFGEIPPVTEVEHWRRILTRYSSAMEFCRSEPAKVYLKFLASINSFVVPSWRSLVQEVRVARNESLDVIERLNMASRSWFPIHNLPPDEMISYMPHILYTLRQVFATSPYFNTPGRAGIYLSKVSNQLLTSCMNYLSVGGTKSMWVQGRKEVEHKVQVCFDLYNCYLDCYRTTNQKMEELPGETPLACSETYIFGKLRFFNARLSKIIDFIMKRYRYSVIEQSCIEGIEEHAKRYRDIFSVIPSRVYNELDYRNGAFDEDYADFLEKMSKADATLAQFMADALCEETNVINSISTIRRFEKLNLPCFDFEITFSDILPQFCTEIEKSCKIYNEYRDSTDMLWNLPPYSGRITWVRSLTSSIDSIKEAFLEKQCMTNHKLSSEVAVLYNSMLACFIHYELVHYKEWKTTVGSIEGLLHEPVLRRTGQDGFEVSFDLYILELLAEAEGFMKLDYNIPYHSRIYLLEKRDIFFKHDLAKYVFGKYWAIKKSIPNIFYNLVMPQLRRVEDVFSPCFSTVTWASLNLLDILKEIEFHMLQLEVFLREAKDIKEGRIEEPLQAISQIELVHCEPTPVTCYQYLSANLERQASLLTKIQADSENIESAVISLINKFVEKAISPNINEIDKYNWFDQEKISIKSPSQAELMSRTEAIPARKGLVNTETLQGDCMEVFNFFNQTYIDAITKAIRTSLAAIEQRTTGISPKFGRKIPIFRTKLLLEIPTVRMRPNIELIQTTYRQAVASILNIAKKLLPWGTKIKGVHLACPEVNTSAEWIVVKPPTPLGAEPPPAVQELQPLGKKMSISPGKGQEQVEEEDMSRLDLAELILPDIATMGPSYDAYGHPLVTFYSSIIRNKEVINTTSNLQSIVANFGEDIGSLLQKYQSYEEAWAEGREEELTVFANSNPMPHEIRTRFEKYERLINDILALSSEVIMGPICFNIDLYKTAVLVELRGCKNTLGRLLQVLYASKVSQTMAFINEQLAILNHPINELNDVPYAMKSLEDIRERFIELDLIVLETNEVYDIMTRFKVPIPEEDLENAYGLGYNFQVMIDKSKEMQEILCSVQEPMKKQLLHGIAKFKAEVEAFDKDYRANGPMVVGISAKEASDRVLLFQGQFDDLWHRYEVYSSGERLFGMRVTEYPILDERKKQFNLLQKLYGLYLVVNRSIDGYYDMIWNKVDIEAIMAEIVEYQNRCRKLPKAMKDWLAFIDLRKKIDDFNECGPLLEMMANKAMKDRHWERLENLLHCKFDWHADDFTLRNVMEAPLLKYKDDVEDICLSAVKEKDIEFKLKQVQTDWAPVELQFATFKNKGELLVKGAETQEIIVALEDGLMVLNSLASNRFNAPFKKDIMQWVYNLSMTSEILEKWLIVQNLWMYLEAVFVGGDIAKQMPGEAKRFATIDKTWIKLMIRGRELVNVIKVCVGDDTMKIQLPYLLDQLETCQKSLTGYLEQKRLIFPRFFFVSDPSLLEILGQASDSHTIQAHLLGCFENIAQVEFSETEYDRILEIVSREGERIELEKSVLCTGGVEYWLGSLLQNSRQSLNRVISAAWDYLSDPEFRVLKMISMFPSQVGLLGIQMLWTRNSEKALVECRWDSKIMKKTNKYFLALLNKLIDQTTKDLAKFERVKFETLITIHVHQRDIFDAIVQGGIRDPLDFEWLKQERFYFNEDCDQCIVKITDVDFLYMNEFLGCTDRLVITPLTDRCYITLAQAIGMSMGGAPAGPAGTGKTETTKDMGKSLGKYVVVFNCSDQMDFRGLGRIFKGLAQSGSWGCFDEFNRIELPVLSVAAQQISIVLVAKKERKASFIFSDGDNVKMDPEFGIFLTMNPGYAGRQELPENLKIMFRTVAMMVPDRQIIIRVKLASCGFRDNILLSRKFFVLYKLCEEQLSKQVHYDFGLRNILSVLRTLGAQKRASPKETEDTTLMRVLRDMNVSKLVDEDEPLFISLIDDLFVGLKLTTSVYKDLQKALTEVCAEKVLTNHPPWNLKVVQLYETSLVRHGLMTMGPTGSGKTTCIHALMAAMTICGRPHREMRMNPKAITAPQMFGRLDVATNDWTDGIFSTLWRRSLKIKKTDNVWLVLDGPVDAVWIENLNSVLDDNKTLTLANGDRIVMAPNSKLVFEPDNVDNASPATVSRMGMVFISSSVLSWSPILDGWLQKRPPGEAEILRALFDRIYDDAHNYLQTKLVAKMKILEALYIRQCTDLLSGLLTEDISETKLEKLFLFAMMWSLGSVLEIEDRLKLEAFLLEHPSKLAWPKNIAEGESLFEYYVTDTGEWSHWLTRVEEYFYPTDYVPDYAGILVPNVDNVRTAFLIDTIAKQSKAVLLIGEQGTAKTVMIKSYMSQYDPEYHLQKSLNFSSATTPNMFQAIIESYVDKRVGTTYGPPFNRKMTIFVDDINMPVINEWGDQVTNEIVRQLMEQGGFYSLEKPGEFSWIVDLQFLAAMIHPGGGRNDIPPRLKRRFNIFNCTLPSDRSMDKIFSVLGQGYFCIERFKEELVEFLPTLVPLTRIIWQRTKVKMLPTPAKFHYVFNLRDLSRIWEGMLTIQDAEVPDVDMLLRLWKHECTRVIADRFVNQIDRLWFDRNLLDTIRAHCPQEIAAMFHNEEYFFVDFLRDAPEPTGDEPEDAVLEAPKIYEMIPSWEFLSEKLTMYMAGYNEIVRGSQMDLVFFRDAMVHLMRISRIIRTPRGSAMLVGVGGSGKQSLTRLASYIANYKMHQITLTRTYNVSNFMDDLKYLYRTAGGENTGMSFIFTDNDIKDEAFLEYLNNVLSAGEIANLFAKDEQDELLNGMIPIMKKVCPKRLPTLENLYDFFITQSRKNLHLVLCFSPVSEKFRSRSLKFPGLISGCTMDWFSRWPRDALVAVSHHFLYEFDMVCTNQVKGQLIELMGEVQDEVADTCAKYYDRFRRRTYVTPKSFLSFLDGYKSIYVQRHMDILVMENQMKTGLKKLVEAAVSVDGLKKELEVREKEIIVANQNAEKVLAEVAVVAAAAEKVQAEVKVVADRASEIVTMIEADKLVAEDKLESARPALEAAEAALLTIKAADIATVRKLGKPPYLITLIMDAVLVLFQKKLLPTAPDPEKSFLVPNWAESLKVMADTRFLFNLQNFPKDKINGETVDLLQPYFRYPLYTFQSAKQACGNVAGLLKWTLAMCDFYGVNKEVLPLKANLAVQQNRLNVAQKELSEAESLLHAKEQELAVAQGQFETAMGEKRAVQEIADKCQAKMDAATALITGLSGEQIRWTEQLAAFSSEIDRLVGDVLMLTGFLSYSGPFNQEYRLMLQVSWHDNLVKRKIPQTDNLNLVENLADAATIGEWNLQGLPNDELSIQNGIIVTKAARFPLLIDPQSQGVIWIRNKEKDAELQITSLNHKYFRQHLEDCLSLGRPLLIEDVLEELDPVLDNVLEKNFIKIGSSLKVKLADKEVDVNKDFRLYITTKLANPSYTPEVSARTSIIDFTVTMKGLEDQLLGRVILMEKKELEQERTNLMQEVTANKRNMKQLEANLLYKLTTVEGSLIDDVSVIQVLNTTKDTAASVRQKLKIAAATEIKINLAREEFRPVAARGSVLYFLVVDMANVNCMYQTSLVQFLERFDISMERSEKSPFTEKRITSIIDYLTFEVFKYKARGLYEVHKYLFTLLVTLKVDLQRGSIIPNEFENFIKGGAALDLNAVQPKPEFKWLTDVTWLNLIKLSELKPFAHITSQVQINDKTWKAWFESPAPEEEILPEDYEQLDIFKKTLIVRAMCPDRVLSQSRKYIASSLGERFVSPVILNIEVLLAESRPETPMICFLSMGSDPTPQIETTAKRHETRCQAISMGQGQEVHARKLMSACMEEGGWVLLQNCHLGIEYMCELFLTITEAEYIDPEFRLWMTTETHPSFPINLLQICLKFTNEPPQGVKAGLTRTYGTMSQDLLDYSNNLQYLPLLYAISFLHTVVQERRKFGPLGWNIPYEFNFADWYASVMFIQNHLETLEKESEVSWVTVRYMIGEVQYGGRVTDDYDKRLLTTFALVWFNPTLFSEDFIFYRGYGVLKYKQLTDYMTTIEAMTDNDPPQVYGLHPNANITFQSNTAQMIFDTIISIQPKESSGGTGETRESVVAKQASDMLKKLPKDFDPYEVKDRLKIMGILNPMNIFLRQELDRMQAVVSNVRRTLKHLLLAIEGTIIMNEALRDALDNIYDARVPKSWLRGSWASSSIGFWFTELLERSIQYSTWIFVNRPPQFWMTGFFNPQGFLTAMRQEVTRAHKGWALDSVILHNTVTPFIKEQVKTPPPEGVYVYGLYLDGAGWDKRNNRLAESMPKVLFLLMPVIHIFAENTTGPKPPELYTCPVYKRPNRTDLQYITALWLPCKFTPAHWILRGVALLCDIK